MVTADGSGCQRAPGVGVVGCATRVPGSPRARPSRIGRPCRLGRVRERVLPEVDGQERSVERVSVTGRVEPHDRAGDHVDHVDGRPEVAHDDVPAVAPSEHQGRRHRERQGVVVGRPGSGENGRGQAVRRPRTGARIRTVGHASSGPDRASGGRRADVRQPVVPGPLEHGRRAGLDVPGDEPVASRGRRVEGFRAGQQVPGVTGEGQVRGGSPQRSAVRVADGAYLAAGGPPRRGPGPGAVGGLPASTWSWPAERRGRGRCDELLSGSVVTRTTSDDAPVGCRCAQGVLGPRAPPGPNCRCCLGGLVHGRGRACRAGRGVWVGAGVC